MRNVRQGKSEGQEKECETPTIKPAKKRGRPKGSFKLRARTATKENTTSAFSKRHSPRISEAENKKLLQNKENKVGIKPNKGKFKSLQSQTNKRETVQVRTTLYINSISW